MKKTNYDFLEKCTKEELIYFIKTKGWLRDLFTYSEVLFRRWQVKTEELREKERQHSKDLDKMDGKKQDEFARQFNKETDINKKLEIASKMKSYDSNLRAWFKKEKQLQVEEKKLDKLYESIDIQRQKEH